MSRDGLDYEHDVRNEIPDPNHHLTAFKSGWTGAVTGRELDEALEDLTWWNLGWRLGTLFSDTSEELQEELFKWCVDQQRR